MGVSSTTRKSLPSPSCLVSRTSPVLPTGEGGKIHFRRQPRDPGVATEPGALSAGETDRGRNCFLDAVFERAAAFDVVKKLAVAEGLARRTRHLRRRQPRDLFDSAG